MNELLRLFILLMCGILSAGIATAGDAAITGRVVITKAMTKKRVTLPSYDLRGASVKTDKSNQSNSGDTRAAELSRVVIYLEGPGLKPASPVHNTMAQRNRAFDPEIVVIPVGSTVSFPNDDPIFHNVFSLSKVKQFDLGYYPKGETRTEKFDKPGIVQVYCHIHPDMSAAVVVLASGAWTNPAADGSFSLSGFPPGTYDLIAWHRFAGFFRRHITVGEGSTPTPDFIIPVKDEDAGAASKAGSGR